MHNQFRHTPGNGGGSSQGEGNEPVLAIFDKEGTLVRVGKPPTDLKGKREVGEYAAEGYTLKTMTIKEFRDSKIKLYEKKNS